MNLAIFDLDHTLINCDSDSEWSCYLVKKGYASEETLTLREQFYADYRAGTLNIQKFLTFQLAPFARFSRVQLDAMHQEFMRHHIIPHIRSGALSLIEKHQRAGDTILMISATNEFIITPIAHHLGFTNVIGVSLEVDSNGNYTGRYIGTPSFKEGKLVRLQEWLKAQGKTRESFAAFYFYSDSKNDLPLLEYVDYPVCVTPDDTLRTVAIHRGWPVLDI